MRRLIRYWISYAKYGMRRGVIGNSRPFEEGSDET